MSSTTNRSSRTGRPIVRVQTGIRIERRILKVLKGIAEYRDMTLGDFLEGVLLHVFEGKAPFQRETLRKITELKKVYDLDLDASDSHQLREAAGGRAAPNRASQSISSPRRRKGGGSPRTS